ncbi:MAG TPA: sodium:solute symporter family protein [Planctomycetota bacterium]
MILQATAPAAAAAAPVSYLPLYVILAYLAVLIGLGLASMRFFRGTSKDYFTASHSVGPVLLLLSVFGTTMTAFAMVGSSAKAYELGIGPYTLMASSSGIVHSLVFFLVGIRLWAIGKRHGHVTQIQYFRDRFESRALGNLLFPILVLLVIPYVLTGFIGAGSFVQAGTRGMFPEAFPATNGAIPPRVTILVVMGVVLFYIFQGGVRGAVWANAFQTIMFLVAGVAAMFMISRSLGGLSAASEAVLAKAPGHLARAGKIGHGEFLSYMLVPLSVGMFPHLFQNWLTARDAKSFRTVLIFHPIFILIVWLPCVLIGVWAVGQGIKVPSPNAVLNAMMTRYVDSAIVLGLVQAGTIAAIMAMDSQIMALGTMFTEDVVVHLAGKGRVSDRAQVWWSRGFIVAIMALSYWLALHPPPNVFDLGVWCFSGFAGLFPLVVAAIYWKRVTTAGAYASVLAMLVTWGVLFWRGLIQPAMAGAKELGEPLVLGVMPVAWVVLAAGVALVAVSLATRPPSEGTIKKYFA